MKSWICPGSSARLFPNSICLTEHTEHLPLKFSLTNSNGERNPFKALQCVIWRGELFSGLANALIGLQASKWLVCASGAKKRFVLVAYARLNLFREKQFLFLN